MYTGSHCHAAVTNTHPHSRAGICVAPQHEVRKAGVVVQRDVARGQLGREQVVLHMGVQGRQGLQSCT